MTTVSATVCGSHMKSLQESYKIITNSEKSVFVVGGMYLREDRGEQRYMRALEPVEGPSRTSPTYLSCSLFQLDADPQDGVRAPTIWPNWAPAYSTNLKSESWKEQTKPKELSRFHPEQSSRNTIGIQNYLAYNKGKLTTFGNGLIIIRYRNWNNLS